MVIAGTEKTPGNVFHCPEFRFFCSQPYIMFIYREKKTCSLKTSLKLLLPKKGRTGRCSIGRTRQINIILPGITILHWIVDSPICDKGTAAMIFWMSEPDFYLDGSANNDGMAEEHDVYRLVLKIIRRFERNDFRSSRYKYDPTAHLPKIPTGIRIPDALRNPVRGVHPISIGYLASRWCEWKRARKLRKTERRKTARRQR